MLFNSLLYLLFLPLTTLAYFLTPAKYRWLILFVSSCLFYMYFVPKYILILFALILIDYFLAIRISNASSQKNRLILLVVSIVSNFGILFHYKYSSYFGAGLNWILSHFSVEPIGIGSEILPIGLSFHTFQSVSYVIDVYRKKIAPEKHLGQYACYVLFFPQMVAGPIEKYEQLGFQLRNISKFSLTFISNAVPLIITGLFYKMVIADNCAVFVNTAFKNPADSSGLSLAVAILFFCFQIYADFFGYSLIAQGSAALLGIKLMSNFNFPFSSTNLFMFWKAWHISLTNWFREYVFFPLGGSRVESKLNLYRNVLIVFALSGLWHGAGNNYILWGLAHGIVYLMSFRKTDNNDSIIVKALKIIFTFCIVALLFLLFRITDLSTCFEILYRIAFSFTEGQQFQIPCLLSVLITVTFLLEYFAKKMISFELFFRQSEKLNFVVLLAMLTCILAIGGIEDLPFIYFQF